MNRPILLGVACVLLVSLGYFFFVGNNEAQAPIPVRLTAARRGELVAAISSDGKIVARKRAEALSPISGVVHDAHREVGSYVRRGQVIATVGLLEPDRYKKKQEWEFARIDLDVLSEQVNQAEELYKAKAISLRDVKELKIRKYKQERMVSNLGDDLKEKNILAEIDGLLGEKLFRDGDRIPSGKNLASIIDTSSLAVEALVPQQNISGIYDGQEVLLRCPTFGGERAGKVLSISQVSSGGQDNDKRSLPEPEFVVYTSLKHDPTDPIFVGSVVTVRLVRERIPDALYLPLETILYREGKPSVFLGNGGRAKLREVGIGSSSDENVQIITGLSITDFVIARGNLDVEEGTQIENSDVDRQPTHALDRSRSRFPAP